MVYWVAAAQILFYLNAIPIRLILLIESENGVQFGFGVALFEKRFAWRRALANMGLPQKQRGTPSVEKLSKHKALLFHFFKALHFDELSFHGEVAFKDAAATALICGSFTIFEYILRPFFPKLSLQIAPQFNKSAPHIHLNGMISLRTGQIISAVTISALYYVNRRISQWINSRLKAS